MNPGRWLSSLSNFIMFLEELEGQNPNQLDYTCSMLGSTFLDKYVFVRATDITRKKNQWGRPTPVSAILAASLISRDWKFQ